LVNTKRRHVATCTVLQTTDQLQLGTFYCSQLLFLLLPRSVISIPISMDISFKFNALRYIVWIVVGFSAGKLKKMILNSGSR
jgi:hypothetical protein